jgi:hypothetical protein
LGLPNCTVEAPTRAEAIRRARAAAAELFSGGDVVEIEVRSSAPTRSLRDFVGMWADDETFDEFVEAMNTYRQEVEREKPAR